MHDSKEQTFSFLSSQLSRTLRDGILGNQGRKLTLHRRYLEDIILRLLNVVSRKASMRVTPKSELAFGAETKRRSRKPRPAFQ